MRVLLQRLQFFKAIISLLIYKIHCEPLSGFRKSEQNWKERLEKTLFAFHSRFISCIFLFLLKRLHVYVRVVLYSKSRIHQIKHIVYPFSVCVIVLFYKCSLCRGLNQYCTDNFGNAFLQLGICGPWKTINESKQFFRTDDKYKVILRVQRPKPPYNKPNGSHDKNNTNCCCSFSLWWQHPNKRLDS